MNSTIKTVIGGVKLGLQWIGLASMVLMFLNRTITPCKVTQPTNYQQQIEWTKT